MDSKILAGFKKDFLIVKKKKWIQSRRLHDTGIGKKISHLTTASIRDIVNEVKMASGIENFSPHYFRHAFAIKALRETGNLALVQDFLGHASPSATRVYAKIYPDDLAAAHQKIFG